jgi:hypothetical protein
MSVPSTKFPSHIGAMAPFGKTTPTGAQIREMSKTATMLYNVTLNAVPNGSISFMVKRLTFLIGHTREWESIREKTHMLRETQHDNIFGSALGNSEQRC